MYADQAKSAIDSIHAEVLDNKIDLDAVSQGKLCQILLHLARGIVSDQRACGGDPAVTMQWVAHMEDAEGTLTEALEELKMDLNASGRRQAQIRRAYLAGDLSRKYELTERA